MFSQYSSSSSSSSKLSSSTMSNSTGSSPTTSRSVPHSSQDTISPLSVSKSTWTSASHSGHVPVGTVSSSHAIGEGKVTPQSGEHPLPCKQPNQSNRERWNLEHSFSQIVGPLMITFLCRKCFPQRRRHGLKRIKKPIRIFRVNPWLKTVVFHICAPRTQPI